MLKLSYACFESCILILFKSKISMQLSKHNDIKLNHIFKPSGLQLKYFKKYEC